MILSAVVALFMHSFFFNINISKFLEKCGKILTDLINGPSDVLYALFKIV